MHASSSIDLAAVGSAKAPVQRRLVADAPTRMFHWLFALSFAGAYLTAESEHWRMLHVTLGYTFAGLLVFRLLYGLFGPRQSSAGLLWRKLDTGPAWLRSLRASNLQGEVNWRQGQNLVMALAVVLMLALVIPVTLSGYATYNDWGGEWLEEAHELFGNAFLTVVGAHLGLIALLSLLRRQNQALPMLTGRVPGAGPSPVQRNRAWLAALLLLAALAFGAWQWQSSPRGLIPWLDGGTAISAHGHGTTRGSRHHDKNDD